MKGWVVLSLGARPFFVLAALWASLAIAIWPAIWAGAWALPGGLASVDWHAHELIFGYGGAVVAGFLLTAIPNWTGRKPVAGVRLAMLVLAWMIGRLAAAVPGNYAALALMFPLGLMGIAGWEILAAGNRRNLKVVAILAAFAAVDGWFVVAHMQDWDTGTPRRGGIAILVLLILLIGGRVVPAFTRNWLKRNRIAGDIADFGRLDVTAMALDMAGLLGWVWRPDAWQMAPLFALAGGFTLARLARWRGWSARRDWLVGVLHLGYLFAGLGFVAAAAHAVWPDRMPIAGVVHLWAVGAIGMTTMAMMTRATLGHTGQALHADGATRGIYLALAGALVARLTMVMLPDSAPTLMIVAAMFWCAGFAGFLVRYGRGLLLG